MSNLKIPGTTFGLTQPKTDVILDVINYDQWDEWVFFSFQGQVIYNNIYSEISLKIIYSNYFAWKIPVNIKILKPAAIIYYSHPSKCQKCT